VALGKLCAPRPAEAIGSGVYRPRVDERYDLICRGGSPPEELSTFSSRDGHVSYETVVVARPLSASSRARDGRALRTF